MANMSRAPRAVALLCAAAASLCLSVRPATALSDTIVISQVYGGAGCGTAGCSTYKNDYVELFNRGSSTVSLAGWSVQYASAAGTSWQVTSLSGSIPPGGYLLVREGAGANGVSELPTPDVMGSIAMSATAAKVALVGSTTALSGACPSSVVDLVGYGATPDCYEGTGRAPAPSTTNAVFRAGAGCTETDQNATDFAAAAASPRNSATALSPCSAPPTSPQLTINDVALSEGNSGTTTLVFTVSLSSPAGAGGVTFDVATADGTAAAPDDYTSKSLTGQTIPEGGSTYTFDVLVNGEATVEGDETFFVNVTNVTGAEVADGQGQGTIRNDDAAGVFIHDVQGSGAATPMAGATVFVEGVVTADEQGSGLAGFFLQEEDADADADPQTSEGVFVYCGSCASAVAEGQRVRVTGTVSEYFGMTEISATSAGAVVVTDAADHLAEVTPAPVDLPVAAADVNAFYEALEGMQVAFVDPLTVSELYELQRYGTVELYEGGRPRQYTDANVPDVSGYAAYAAALARRRVLLDDEDNGVDSWSSRAAGLQAVFHPRANGGLSAGTQGVDFFRAGDVVSGLTGVLHWSFSGGTSADAWRVRPTAATPVAFTVANPRPTTPPAVGGAIRVASLNVLNYFTTLDGGASICGPSGTLGCRGANTASELVRQRAKLVSVVCSLNPDVAGLLELENTTASTTITDLLSAVNASCGGTTPYAAVDTGGTLGTDAIRGVLIYRTGTIAPVGAPLVDMDSVFERPPTAQAFEVADAASPAFGRRFTLVVNHLRSKGCSSATGANADAGDGQGCYAARRTDQAARLLSWVTGTVVPAAGDPDVLLVGDFNSYARENPITTLEAGGFASTHALHQASPYTYVYDGLLGQFDYALASSTLVGQVTGAAAWHVNADEAPLFDYNEEKPDGSALAPPRVLYATEPYRAADHDPLLVGLFGTADLAITLSDSPDPATPGAVLTYTIDVTNAGPDGGSAEWTATLAGTVFGTLTAPASWTCTTPAVGASGSVSCSVATLAPGAAATFSLAVAVTATSDVSATATVLGSAIDPNPANNSASAVTHVVALVPTTTALGSSANPSTFGAPVTFTATVLAGGPAAVAVAGDVRFQDGATLLGHATLVSGTASLTVSTLTIGGHDITATYEGSAGLAGSTSGVLVQTVAAGGSSGEWLGSFAGEPRATTDVGDFDGDGLTDLLEFERDAPDAIGDVRVALSTGLAFAPAAKWHDWFAVSPDEQVVVGDFDGDGRDDVATWLARSTRQVYVALSSGAAFLPPVVWLDAIGFEEGDVLSAGDVDGDGREDLVLFARRRGQVHVALSTGTGFAAATQWHSFFAVSTYERPRVADVTGDGRADIVTFATDSPTAHGDVYVAVSDGTRYVDLAGVANMSTKWHDWFAVRPDEQVRIADRNGDGKDDFFTILPLPWGQCYSVLSRGTEMGPNELWPEIVLTDARDEVFAGDVNGDGKADLITFARTTGKVRVSLGS